MLKDAIENVEKAEAGKEQVKNQLFNLYQASEKNLHEIRAAAIASPGGK